MWTVIAPLNPASQDETYELLRERNRMAWVGLYLPNKAEIRSVREVVSGSCTCSSGCGSSSPSGRPNHRTCHGCGRRLERSPDLLCMGPEAVLYAIWIRSSTSTPQWSPARRTHR